MFFPFLLPGWWLLLPAVAFVMYSQWKVKSTYQRYARMPSTYRLSGAQVARRLLDDQGLHEVAVQLIAGLFVNAFHGLLGIGVVVFAAAVLFQLVTLPVELDASRRALALLTASGFVDRTELSQTRKVLSAAALTYVAAAAVAVMQLLQFGLLLSGGGRSRN